MPIPVVSTAIPAFLNPSAQAGLLPTAGSRVVRSGESRPLQGEPVRATDPVPTEAPAADLPQSEPANVIPPPEPQGQPQGINDRRELPLQTQQALQAFEQSAESDNRNRSDAIERINIFV